jgi:hypothetical protein
VLAYVFWHRPREAADGAGYEHAQVVFHASLSGSPPAGFAGSRSFRVPELPWLAGGGYEDWYLVEDFTALGALAAGVTAPEHRSAHDSAARAFERGAAALYSLRDGPADAALESRCTRARWIERPLAASYPTLADFALAAEEGASLWSRELVLGPAPELCLAAPAAAAPETGRWTTIDVEREAL